jgi:uncharacterized Fe-S cluster protein YjdI
MKNNLLDNQKIATTTFGNFLQDIIEPQIEKYCLKNPKCTKSDSLRIEKPYIPPGTVRVANVIKVMKSLHGNNLKYSEDDMQSENEFRKILGLGQFAGRLTDTEKLSLARRVLERQIRA